MSDALPRTSVAPDLAEAVVGWRGWSLARTRDGMLLGSLVQRRFAWPPREPMRATCALPIGGHRAPLPACSCGIYAADHPLGVARVATEDLGVMGTVAMWGRVVEHARGYRAALAYPDRLALVCGRCLAIRRVGRPATVIDRGEGVLQPLCELHARGRTEMRLAVDEVERALLDAYAVDRLAPDDLAAAGLSSSPPIPKTPSDVVRSGRTIARRERGRFASVVVLMIVSFFVARTSGVLGPDVTEGWRSAATPATAAPVFEAPSVLATDPPRRHADVVEQPRERVPWFHTVCGVPISYRAAALRDCGDPRAFLLGLVDAPAIPRSDCPRPSAYSRQPRFSVCWLVLEGSARGRLALPGVHRKDIRAAGS